MAAFTENETKAPMSQHLIESLMTGQRGRKERESEHSKTRYKAPITYKKCETLHRFTEFIDSWIL